MSWSRKTLSIWTGVQKSLREQQAALFSSRAEVKKRPTDSGTYCAELVRNHDFEGFLCILLQPNDLRRSMFAIRAFSTELALIRDMVSTPALGVMRLQFWRDSLDLIYKGLPPLQPVAQELARVLSKTKVSKHWLKRLIDCREQTLYDHPHHSLKDLEDYSHNSVSSAYNALLEIAGIRDVNADHLADHAGKAQGLTYALRGIPFNASKNRVTIPTQLLAKHGVSHEDFLRGRREGKMKDVIFEIATHAYTHLQMVTNLQSNLSKNTRTIFLPIVPCKVFLNKLEKKDFDIFDPALHRRDNFLALRLWWSARLKGGRL